MKTTEAILIAGGNRGDAERMLERVERELERTAGRITARSGIYRTAAWGFASEDFLNRVFVLETPLGAEALLDAVQDAERAAGRDREAEEREKSRTGQRYASRTADIDILFYGSECIDTPRLKVPHPLMAERMFVLGPLDEVAPHKVHPETGLTVRDMLLKLKNTSREGRNKS